MTKEEIRLEATREKREHWQRRGPYLSERGWGTVREDYSPHGKAWEYLSHDQARSRATGGTRMASREFATGISTFVLRWRCGTGGILLKERLFGLTGNEGNHARMSGVLRLPGQHADTFRYEVHLIVTLKRRFHTGNSSPKTGARHEQRRVECPIGARSGPESHLLPTVWLGIRGLGPGVDDFWDQGVRARRAKASVLAAPKDIDGATCQAGLMGF